MLKPLLFSILISIQLIAQTTYYVSSSQGNDSNNGTSQSSPWKTLDKVNSFNFNPGSNILLKRGDSWFNQYLLINDHGTAGNYITIGAYGTGNKPIISAENSYSAHIRVESDYIIIDGIYVGGIATGSGPNIQFPHGISINGNYNTVRNCLVEGSNSPTATRSLGIYITGRNAIVEDNEVAYHTKSVQLQPGSSNPSNTLITRNILRDNRPLADGDGDGVKVASGDGNTTGTIISHNDFSGWSDDAIDGRGINLLIEYNVFHNPQDSVAGGTGIKFGYMPAVPEQSKGGIARYNIFRDWNITERWEPARGWAILLGSSDQQCYYNLLYNITGSHGISKLDGPHDNIKIYNNTIWEVGGMNPQSGSPMHAVIFAGNASGSTNIELRNNIIKGKDGDFKDVYFDFDGIISTNNVYVNNNIRTGSYAIIQSNNFTGSPTFINLNNNNYRLSQQDTKARDKANILTGIPLIDLDGNLVPFGLIPDIGAYEYGSTGGSNNINVNLNILLEGSFNSGSMATTLLNNGQLPLNQPYNQVPWNYNGNESVSAMPSGVVDWVLIELRTETTSSTTAGRKAAFLKSDGSVVALDGVSKVTFDGLPAGSYYVVIRHRNHLAVMSANPLSLSDNSTLYDFTTGQGKAYGTNPLSDLGNGKWGITAGDGDINGLVNVIDYGTVGNFLFNTGYEFGDLDMNGIINVMDYAKTNLNLFRNSQVPN